uniref:Uncharacterized protein n=1 Tax=Rhizophora mucronata TaxID=61149 RepID=A0A2P2P5U5_RHIMU
MKQIWKVEVCFNFEMGPVSIVVIKFLFLRLLSPGMDYSLKIV